MSTKFRFAIWAMTGAISLSGCRSAEKIEKPIKPVQVEQAQNYFPGGENSSGERYSANIMPSMQMELAFKNGGYISDIARVSGNRYIQEGDVAAKGTVLARLRKDDFASKISQAEALVAEAQSTTEANKAQLSEAEAAFRQAERDLNRATNLLENRSLTKPEFEGARTKHELAQARVEAVRAQSKVIEAKISGAQAILSEARLAQQDAALRAPFDCYVLKKMIEPGSMVAPGRPVFVVADRSSLKAIFGVPDLTVRNVKIGTQLKFTTEAIPDMEFSGWISRISPAADPKSRAFDVEATIPRPSRELRLGMIASLTLPTGRSSSPVLVVPINAIVRLKQSPEDYAVNVVSDQAGKQVAQQRRVKLGQAFGNMIAVTEGISLGDRVIISGSALIVDGEQVRVIQ
ncbi:MAG: efflux RND transporter periplasmic adaptor subunit [Acidobacteria bacterium]|nr:efflux RND transporter periplasmic adaptor subunit [Acidobacteriota bacterium]